MGEGLPAVGVLEAMHEAVLDWYAATARPLAFRGTTDPYAILVSELMAQQTQASRAAEAWRSFLETFPTFAALAAASPAAVLRAWRGLGYNRRALALRRIAQAVVIEHGGRLPADVAALERLPGVGPYTARAVAALAFGQAVGPVDTNVRRVLRRALLGLDPVRPSSAAGRATAPPEPALGPPERAFQDLADAVVPTGRAGAWTHALMDVGATLCRPRAPRCASCPLQPWCRWAVERGVSAEATHREDRAGPNGAGPNRAGPNGAGPNGAGRGPRRAAEAPTPFTSTTRWLRGRIVERLCDAADGEWVALGERLGEHDAGAIDQALEALGRDGLVERHPWVPRLARLPLA